MRSCKLILCLVISIFILLEGGYAYEKENSLTFGVIPKTDPDCIFKSWDPLLKELSRSLGIKLELRLFKNISDFEKALLEGKMDFVYVSPYHMIMAKNAQGYIPLIRDKNPLRGVIVVRKDSPYTNITDLRNVTIALPTPNSFISLYIRGFLMEKFKIKISAKYVKTPENVYRHVAMGLAHAGGGSYNTFLQQPAEIRETLRIIYETPNIASHPIAVHPRVPKEIREAFVKAFLSLYREKFLTENFRNIKISNPTLADYHRDYQPLERLKLDKYVILETN